MGVSLTCDSWRWTFCLPRRLQPLIRFFTFSLLNLWTRVQVKPCNTWNEILQKRQVCYVRLWFYTALASTNRWKNSLVCIREPISHDVEEQPGLWRTRLHTRLRLQLVSLRFNPMWGSLNFIHFDILKTENNFNYYDVITRLNSAYRSVDYQQSSFS